MLGTSSRTGQASPSTRAIEVEQAAHALRQRLAVATSHQAQSPHSLTVQFLRDNGFSTTPVSTNNSASSSLSPSTAHTSVSGDCDASGVRGLGIGTADGDADEHLQLYEPPSSMAQASTNPPRRLNTKSSQPSLYDAIFGPLVGRIALPGGFAQQADSIAATKGGISASPIAAENKQRSPHVRQGSSAFLEQVALSPHMSTPHLMAPSPRQLAAERELFTDLLHDTPMLSLYDSPSQLWLSSNGTQSPASSQSSWLSARQHDRPGSHTADGAAQPLQQSSSYGHKRMRSLGGSVLPNGHPASSLAQDLGLASGGHGRVPRSRNASAANSDMLNGRSAARTDQESMAGFLLANLASSPRLERDSAHLAGGNTPGRTSTSAFVDPNFATPRRRQRTSAGDVFTPPSQMASLRHSNPRSPKQLNGINEGHSDVVGSSNEAAAHMLLDLAASPSRDPSRASFPGHTPSLQEDLLPARKLNSTPSRGSRGHARIRSMGDVRIFAPDTPPSALRNGSQSRTSSQIGRVRLMSPPITPPDSDDVRSLHKTEQGDRAGMHRSTSPVSPSRRHSTADAIKSLQIPASEEHALPITPTRESHDPLLSNVKVDGQSKLPMETPRTPPLKATTPRTPKAPGSNFSYGEFLHMSPSPQPRMRTENGLAQLPVTTETPTRATRSRARFLDFSQPVTASSAAASNGERDCEPTSDEESLFTVGRLPARRVSGSSKGLGLGDALELRETQVLRSPAASAEQKDAVAGAHVLVPGKRAAIVLQSSPTSTSKRSRAAASS